MGSLAIQLNAAGLQLARNSASLQIQQLQNNQILSIQQRDLRDCFPGLYYEMSATGQIMGAVVDDFVGRSPEVYPTTKWHALESEELRQYYHSVIKLASQATPGAVENQLSNAIMGHLIDQFELDMSSGSIRMARTFKYTLKAFRSLADISSSCQSELVGTVLYTFFSDNATPITANEGSNTLLQWCFAILELEIPNSTKTSCFRKILSRRPELVQKTEGVSGPKIRLLAPILDEVLDGMSKNQTVPLRQDYYTQRPHASRRRHRTRSRSRSRRSLGGGGREVARVRDAVEDAQDALENVNGLLRLNMSYKDTIGNGRQRAIGYDSSEDEYDSDSSGSVAREFGRLSVRGSGKRKRRI